MFRALLISTAITCVVPRPVQAGPIVSGISFLVGGGGFGAVTSIWGFASGTLGFALISGGLKLAGSLLLSQVSRALAGKPRQAQVIRELLQPTSLPAYRHVYGDCWAPGTPAPVRVKGRIAYGCWILNSRASEGPFTVYLDKRAVEATGDPYDFSGSGATATNDPFGAGRCRYWIGRGEQVGPPADILAEAPEHFEATDGWRGLTVIWMRLDAGPNSSRAERWPATPPEVMVGGRYSRVWNPRDAGQNPADPATWAWSDNQALCVLDALRQNPLRRYDLRNLWVDTFAWAADVADELVPVKGGGTIPRYAAAGVLVFAGGTEIEDQVQPLADAGASRFIRVGGRLGLLPGCWRDPVMVLDDVLSDQPLAFRRYSPSGDLATAVTATYTSPLRAFEDAPTPVFTLAGAQAEDGGEEKLREFDLRFVVDHRQAQRVAKIAGMRTRMQRTITGVFPPAALNIVAGSVVALALPAPFQGRNGIYEVEEANPAADPLGDSGVAIRSTLALREISTAVFAWDAEAEESAVVMDDWMPEVGVLQPPGAATVISDASTVLVSGDTAILRVRFEFDPSPSSSVISYEWQFRQDAGPWQAGGMIDGDVLDGDGDVFGFLAPVQIGQSYSFRYRAVSPVAASEWVESSPVIASAGSYMAPAPTGISATPGAGQITVTFRAPNDPDYRAMEIWAATTNSSGAASLLFGPVYGAPNSNVSEVHSGLGSGATRYYFARSIDRNGNTSPFSASISATTT